MVTREKQVENKPFQHNGTENKKGEFKLLQLHVGKAPKQEVGDLKASRTKQLRRDPGDN